MHPSYNVAPVELCCLTSVHDIVLSLIVSGDRPKLHELQFLEGVDGRELRVIKTVAPKWKHVAIALGFAVYRIGMIKRDYQFVMEEACMEMFMSWLEGESGLAPCTWDTLIMCLRQAALTYVADGLRIILKDKSGMCDYA